MDDSARRKFKSRIRGSSDTIKSVLPSGIPIVKKNRKKSKVRQPNQNELGSRPKETRIVWVAYSEKGGKRHLHMGATWEGMNKAQLKSGPLKDMMVIDLKVKRMVAVEPVKFGDAWRIGYLNPKFGIKKVAKLAGLDKSEPI